MRKRLSGAWWGIWGSRVCVIFFTRRRKGAETQGAVEVLVSVEYFLATALREALWKVVGFCVFVAQLQAGAFLAWKMDA